MFTCLVPRYQWVFSNVAGNARTQKLKIFIATRSMEIRICYQEIEELKTVSMIGMQKNRSDAGILKVVPASCQRIVIRIQKTSV